MLADPRLKQIARVLMLASPRGKVDVPQDPTREELSGEALMQLLNPGQRNRLRDRIATDQDVMRHNVVTPPPYRIDDQGNVLARTRGEAQAQDADLLRREGVRRMLMGDTPVPQVPMSIESLIGEQAPERVPLPQPRPMPQTRTPLPKPRPQEAPPPYYDDE